ncbi:MAG: adenosylcobinamide amidohydrolase [Bdellovibrionia bacterium]
MQDLRPPILHGKWLEVPFARPHSILSWAIWGGGWKKSPSVLWYQVTDQELSVGLDPMDYYGKKLHQRGFPVQSVGFLTSAPLDSFCHSLHQAQGIWVRAVATVGLSNALRIGDPSFQQIHAGTINLLLQTSVPLSLEASLEAVSLVTEARTLAMLQSQVLSPLSQKTATGTGTDCIAVASPDQPEVCEVYAGKHTVLGFLIGQCVMEVMAQGIQKWKDRMLGQKTHLHSAC